MSSFTKEEITPVHACALAERPFWIRRAKSEEGIKIENEILFQIKSEAAIDDEKPKEAKDEEREEEIEAYEESTKWWIISLINPWFIFSLSCEKYK